MPQFPPFPTWDSLHPMIIHFPVVLLLLSPLFLLISAVISPSRSRPYLNVALVLLLLGTGSLFLASSTGEAAARLAERGGPVDDVLQRHESLASATEIVFSFLSILLAGIAGIPALLKRQTRVTTTWMPLSFLVLYCAGIFFVVNTAHAGARLVHEFGVHAIIPAETLQSSAPEAASEANESNTED